MINASTAFKTALANDQRNYIKRAVITLADDTVLNLDNSNIWQNGFTIEDATSSDGTFDVGAAIINRASLTINNIYDDFSAYDFDGAKVVMYVGLDLDGTEEMLRKGTYIVDEPSYNGEIIKLSLLDYMSKFDVPYSNSTLVYPATLGEIVREACAKCDVTLNTQTFPHSTLEIPTRPNGDSTTFREVIAAAAQIAGCFARCNTWGELEIKWYDIASLKRQYSSIDGGYFDGGRSEFAILLPYMNTTDGMDVLRTGRVDDSTTSVTGVSWFTFDGYTASTIYVNSNSWVNIGKPSTSTSSTYVGHLNLCRRDGSMHGLYRQEGSANGIDFLKIRFEGFTRYQPMYEIEENAIQWELFLLSNGKILINVLKTPTNPSYIGTSNLVTQSQTLALAIADGNGSAPTIGLYTSGGAWSLYSLSYSSGYSADGGTFNPWNTGAAIDSETFDSIENVHRIYSIYSLSASTDDVVITGLRVITKYKDPETGEEETRTRRYGTDGYVIVIENNCLLADSIANTVKNYLGVELVGIRFRKLSCNHSSDPTIEAGDVAILYDRKYHSYPFLVTGTTFDGGGSQKSQASAQTPAKNSAARFSQETKNYVALREQIIDEKTDRELALEDLTQRLDETSQMYITNETDSGGNLTAIIIHNKPTKAESDIVWKITTNAFGVSTDGGQTYNLGATADGNLIANVLSAIGVNADWINTGTLTVGGQGNLNGSIRVLNSSGNQIGQWSKDGITINQGSINLGNGVFSVSNAGAMTCTNATISNKSSDLEARLQTARVSYYQNDNLVSYIGLSKITGHTKYGPSFYLVDGDHISWSARENGSQKLKLCYSTVNDSTNNLVADNLNMFCNLNMNGNKIADPAWRIGNIDYPGVSTTISLSSASRLIFKNGILTGWS